MRRTREGTRRSNRKVSRKRRRTMEVAGGEHEAGK